MISLAIVFTCGLAYELGCAFWVHYSEQNRIAPAAAWSAFNCLVACMGLGETLHNPSVLLAYALGFSTGTAIAILAKRRLTSPALPGTALPPTDA